MGPRGGLGRKFASGTVAACEATTAYGGRHDASDLEDVDDGVDVTVDVKTAPTRPGTSRRFPLERIRLDRFKARTLRNRNASNSWKVINSFGRLAV